MAERVVVLARVHSACCDFRRLNIEACVEYRLGCRVKGVRCRM
jgi:hypothetical protein